MTTKRRLQNRKKIAHLAQGWETGGGTMEYSSFAPFELSQTVAVLTQAVESNERQIQEVAQSSARQIKDLAVLIEKQGAQSNSRLESLAENFQASQRPNYMLWVGVITVMFMLISSAWKITDLQTQVTMAPIAAKAEISQKDRDEIHKEVGMIRDSQSTLIAQTKGFDQKLVEIETQFRSSDRSRNVQFAEQQRMNNVILQIAQGTKPVIYPSGPYYFPETTGDGANSPH